MTQLLLFFMLIPFSVDKKSTMRALMYPIIPDRIRHVKNRQANRLA